jgi:GT2 family glycosyltransferase
MNDSGVGATFALVILNWNGADDTIECLTSLRQSSVPVHAIVVDNGSAEAEVERIRRSGLADSFIAMGTNLGYAEGNNVGLRFALKQAFPLIAVLNNDTVVDADSFSRLLEHLAVDEPRALSPVIRYFDDPSRAWFEGGVVDKGWPRHLQPDEIPAGQDALRPSECLSGCCIAARSETWERVGLFDPRYFLIFEDSDWSLRARRCGVKLYVATESVIRHKVSRSFESGPPSLLGNFYSVRNGLLFEARYARRYLPAFTLMWLVRPSVSALLRRQGGRAVFFRWLGALAFIARARGRAPTVLERLAGRLTRSAPEPLDAPTSDRVSPETDGRRRDSDGRHSP